MNLYDAVKPGMIGFFVGLWIITGLKLQPFVSYGFLISAAAVVGAILMLWGILTIRKKVHGDDVLARFKEMDVSSPRGKGQVTGLYLAMIVALVIFWSL